MQQGSLTTFPGYSLHVFECYTGPLCPWLLRRCAAVHPGYGFLSENVDFVEACESKGIAFLGPTADTMRMFSRKHTAREFAAGAQCPVLPGAPGT